MDFLLDLPLITSIIFSYALSTISQHCCIARVIHCSYNSYAVLIRKGYNLL
jgi:hypothetical protein